MCKICDINVTTLMDAYKFNHWNQYPLNTEYVYSYLESRIGAEFDETVFFSLQAKMHCLKGRVVTIAKIDEGEELAAAMLGNKGMFNRDMWVHILKNHDGRLPLKIKAIPEGTPVPTSNILMSVENTDPKCGPLTNHFESYLEHVWAPSTVATLSRECKKLILQYLKDTSDNFEGLDFMLHDFAFRSATSVESAGIEGAGQLLSFKGTDTVRAVEVARDFYNADITKTGFSVPATEHSVMTALGESGEFKMVSDLLDKYPTGILSIVGDSYDIYRFVYKMGSDFKERILRRDGVFVVRPDSVTKDHPNPASLVVWIAERLFKDFGGAVNSKGFAVINPKIRILWGDGLDLDSINHILLELYQIKFSAENMACFGMGSGLTQKINRDTQRFAFKSSAQCRDGKWYDISKKPLDSTKASKKGRLILCRNLVGGFETRNINDVAPETVDLLKTVYKDGEIVKKYTFDEVRENAKI